MGRQNRDHDCTSEPARRPLDISRGGLASERGSPRPACHAIGLLGALKGVRAVPDDDFEAFFALAEPRLRVALVGAFGPDLGRESAADALTWGWQNWERLRAMTNPIGYLYRVGRSAALKEVGLQSRQFPTALDSGVGLPDYEPMLAEFMAELSEHQRVAVWMVHGLGHSHGDVADVLECSKPTVATHVRRALRRLRRSLQVDADV